jgi:peptidoglycan L-alanyl-D-glutamate endopeptidase CwlK
MVPLRGSVGVKGKNLRDDVVVVQQLLKSKGVNPGKVDGICGAKTVTAICAFQKKFMSTPDGLIEPGRTTWKKIAAIVDKPASPKLLQWSGDSSQWSQPKKLLSMNTLLRPKVEALLAALKERGFQPKVFFGWRSVAKQLELYQQGNSKVKFSFHNAQNQNGTPNSYAADIIDSRYGWGPQAKTSGFWDALGEEAKKQSLYWGGDWASFRDWAHVQLVANSMLASVKKESGL